MGFASKVVVLCCSLCSSTTLTPYLLFICSARCCAPYTERCCPPVLDIVPGSVQFVDAARANWGGAWRMPTDGEWTELRDNCTWTWTTDYNGTGVKGRIATSNINGNSIFLPAEGYRNYDVLSRAGNYGYYWSSSLNTDNPNGAWDVGFYSDDVGRNDGSRYCGLSVRPVLGE